MISAAHLAVVRAESGLDPDLDTIPPFQFSEWFAELSRVCPDVLSARPGIDYNRQRNALRVEIVPGSNRCKRQSPDGRGLAWLLSGGSPIAYGICGRASCPRTCGTGMAR